MQTDNILKINTVPHFALNWKAGRKFIETTVFPIMKRLRHSQSSAKKKITARNFSRSSMWRKKTYLLVSSVSLQDIYITPEELLLTAEQRTELLSAYEKDVLNTDIRKLGEEVPIGEFSLTIRHVPNKETNTNQPFHSWVNGTREWNAAVNTAFPVLLRR